MQNLASSYRLVEEKLTQNKLADKKSLNNICYAMGDRYSVVDPYLLVFYRWGNRLGLDMKSHYPSWTRQTQLLLERPAVISVLAAEGISVWQ